jgi:hypothetical protein
MGKGKLKVKTGIFRTFLPCWYRKSKPKQDKYTKHITTKWKLIMLPDYEMRWSYRIWIPAWYLNKTLWYNHRCIIWSTLPSRAWNEGTSWISPAGHSSSSIGMWTSASRGMYRRINRGTTRGRHRIEKFWVVKFTCIPVFTLSRF